MNAIVAAIGGKANGGAEQLFGKPAVAVRSIAAVMQKLHELYPKKTDANIAVRAGVSTRAVEYWRARDDASRRDMSARAFIALLLSEDGAAVLDAAMSVLPTKERPRWWVRHSNTARLAAIEMAQAAQDEEIRHLRLDLLK